MFYLEMQSEQKLKLAVEKDFFHIDAVLDFFVSRTNSLLRKVFDIDRFYCIYCTDYLISN